MVEGIGRCNAGVNSSGSSVAMRYHISPSEMVMSREAVSVRFDRDDGHPGGPRAYDRVRTTRSHIRHLDELRLLVVHQPIKPY
jgi:hypothetical protein